VLSAFKVPQSLCVNFSVQALAKGMGWQVLSASKVPQILCLNFSMQTLARVMGSKC
jgi:hypothetical protein